MLIDELLLLPRPKKIELFDGVFAMPDKYSPIFASDSDLGKDAYILEITPQKVIIATSGKPGRHNALATFTQLQERFGCRLPCLRIEDAPDFAIRGVMLDVTRGRVWTMEHLKQTIRTLASWKINHLQLYFEHTFASPGNERIWGEWSPLTSAELRELDAFAAQYGMELAPCQNSFGHLTIFLMDDEYRHLAEIPPGGSFESWGARSSVPQSLCPTDPAAIAWLAKLYESLLPNFSGSFVNLGCDETLDLGFGRSRDIVKRDGLPQVFAEYIGKLCKLVEPYHKHPAIWADMVLRFPEILDRLTPELKLLAWGYDADFPFDEQCRLLREHNRTFWVCPGTSCWSNFFGNTSRRRQNLQNAAATGLKYGAEGFMITEWGDGGHRQFWPSTLHALADGAQTAWNSHAHFSPAAAGYRAFNSESTGWFLEAAGDLENLLRQAKAASLFADLHIPVFSFPGRNHPGQDIYYLLTERMVCELKKQIPADAPEIVRRELACASELARIAALRAVLRRQGRLPRLKILGRQLEKLLPEFRELWLLRSRPGGVENAVQKYLAVADELTRIY